MVVPRLIVVGDFSSILQNSVKMALEMFKDVKTTKRLLILVVTFTNTLLFLTSVFLIYSGGHLSSMNNNYDVIPRLFHYDASALFLISGPLFVLVAALGIVGVMEEHPKVIEYHIWSLILLLTTELIISVTVLPLPHNIPANTINAMNTTMEKYEKCWFEKKTFDFIQNDYMCCGIYGPQDWKRFNFQEGIVTSQNETFGVPKSCCDGKKCEKIYLDGCLKAVKFLVKRSYKYFVYTFGCMALLQFLEIVLAGWLMAVLKKIRNMYMMLRALKFEELVSQVENQTGSLNDSEIISKA